MARYMQGRVASDSVHDLRSTLAAVGLRMDSFLAEFFISPTATVGQSARFEGAFGAR